MAAKFEVGTRVWVFTDDEGWVRGTVVGPRELITLWVGNNKVSGFYNVDCSRSGVWPIGEDRIYPMSPLDMLAEIE